MSIDEKAIWGHKYANILSDADAGVILHLAGGVGIKRLGFSRSDYFKRKQGSSSHFYDGYAVALYHAMASVTKRVPIDL